MSDPITCFRGSCLIDVQPVKNNDMLYSSSASGQNRPHDLLLGLKCQMENQNVQQRIVSSPKICVARYQ